jgi:hypothetical protein
MKRFLQVVAVGLIAVLAVPASVAEGICFMVDQNRQATMPGCCAHMNQATMRAMEQGFAMAGSAGMRLADASMQAQSCGRNCCSVSPQMPPVQTAQDKSQSTMTQAPYASLTIALLPDAACEAAIVAPPGGAAAPRHILLKTLRI